MINRYYIGVAPDERLERRGEFMRSEDVLEVLRQLEDALLDYTDGTYDNDQICDVSWVKTRLQEELE